MTPKAAAKKAPRRRVARKPGAPRLRVGERIALAAAILLFILMFFDWYGAEATSATEALGAVVSGSTGGSAWETLEVAPLLLMLTIAVTVGAVVLRLSGSDWKPAIPPSAAVCVLGGLAALGILWRIVSPPDLGTGVAGIVYHTSLKLPIFLALAAALGIAYGGWRTMGEEGTSFASVGKKLESPRRT
jgi:hypothetical protein